MAMQSTPAVGPDDVAEESDAGEAKDVGQRVHAGDGVQPSGHHRQRRLRRGEEQPDEDRQLHDRRGPHVAEPVREAETPTGADRRHPEPGDIESDQTKWPVGEPGAGDRADDEHDGDDDQGSAPRREQRPEHERAPRYRRHAQPVVETALEVADHREADPQPAERRAHDGRQREEPVDRAVGREPGQLGDPEVRTGEGDRLEHRHQAAPGETPTAGAGCCAGS